MGMDIRSSRDSEPDSIFMPGGRAAAKKTRLSHLDPGLCRFEPLSLARLEEEWVE